MSSRSSSRLTCAYLPLYVFCGRHLLAAKLRRANIDAAAGSVEEVARIVAHIRRRWPLCALRRIGLHHTPFAKATCGTIRLKLLKIGALVRVSVRCIKVAMASACPAAHAWGCAATRLAAAANARASPA